MRAATCLTLTGSLWVPLYDAELAWFIAGHQLDATIPGIIKPPFSNRSRGSRKVYHRASFTMLVRVPSCVSGNQRDGALTQV